PDCNDCSRAAVPGRLRLVETAADGLHCRSDPVPLYFTDDLAHQIGPRPGLVEQTLAGKLRRRALSSCRDDRCRDAYEHTPRKQLWRRNFLHGDLAGARVLKKLLHAVAACCGASISDSNLRAPPSR